MSESKRSVLVEIVRKVVGLPTGAGSCCTSGVAEKAAASCCASGAKVERTDGGCCDGGVKAEQSGSACCGK